MVIVLYYLAGLFFLAAIASSLFGFFPLLGIAQSDAQGLFWIFIAVFLLSTIVGFYLLSRKVSLTRDYPYLYYIMLFFFIAMIAAVLKFYVLTGNWGTGAIVLFYLGVFYMIFTLITGLLQSRH